MILEKDELDAVAISEDGQREVLEIFDHLDWENEDEHISLLQNKINSYLVFIQNGQPGLSKENRKSLSKVKMVVIETTFQYPPSEECLRFLKWMQQKIHTLEDVKEIRKDRKLMKNAGKLKNVFLSYTVNDPGAALRARPPLLLSEEM
jgi:hypothetical protein